MDVALVGTVVGVVPITLIGAICDARTKRLPNSLTVSALVLALVYHIAMGAYDGGWAGGAAALGRSLAGFATGFGILFVLWLIGGGGGGDVKMMAALGAWIGSERTLYVFLLSVVLIVLISCGVLAVQSARHGYMRVRRRYLQPGAPAASGRRGSARHVPQDSRTRRRLMPFGVPLALSTWAVLAFEVLKG